MCGRYVRRSDKQRIAEHFHVHERRELSKVKPSPLMEPPPHLAPLIERFRAQTQLV
jgi:putative SOS response-associated peptidase YedK